MSSLIRSMAEAHEENARSIQDFLWEGKPFKSPKIERSKEEMEKFLEDLRLASWSRYNEAAVELGWRNED